ncbi:hypothetical protein EDEG_01268 [Edhazardia aedis USNM 41457]|uniref:Biotin carboxylation domain-containing protein n=1 Tax=Edhazardia aedis (strain USNM 41457) TaxID=1003232 RepID=J9DPL6_EDHAE|nr:hypothetical protein EDEG_01268 [Edhazardia aedis USNM 41457]|eukprot:EJW04500.1 hypothetical protein EDEG_01268 [Edhazardia aedis USNM 41457]
MKEFEKNYKKSLANNENKNGFENVEDSMDCDNQKICSDKKDSENNFTADWNRNREELKDWNNTKRGETINKTKYSIDNINMKDFNFFSYGCSNFYGDGSNVFEDQRSCKNSEDKVSADFESLEDSSGAIESLFEGKNERHNLNTGNVFEENDKLHDFKGNNEQDLETQRAVKILIANNSLSALKVIYSLSNYNIEFYGLTTKEDLHMTYINYLTNFVILPSGPSSNNYTNIDLIVDAAKRFEVDFVYPGWGYLSENYLFPKNFE